MEFRRIRELREDNNLNQTEIAKILKITQQQYSLYEKGLRTIPVEYIPESVKLSKLQNDVQVPKRHSPMHYFC